jgi:hypothetical protein
MRATKTPTINGPGVELCSQLAKASTAFTPSRPDVAGYAAAKCVATAIAA